MNRKVNTEIRNKLYFVGVVEEKYKHYMMYEPYQDKFRQKTKE